MDIIEQLEAGCQRTLQQDEEEEAASTAGAHLEPPIMLWDSQLRAKLFPQGVQPRFMVVAASRMACALISHAFSSGQGLFSIVLPEVPMKGNTVQPSLQDRTCVARTCGPSGEGLLVSCQYHDSLAPERSQAFCKALMEHVRAQEVLVLGSLQAEQYHGPGDASQEAAVFKLCTSAALKRTASASLPALPSGNVVGGLPAAVLTYCQLRNIPATALLALEMVPHLCARGLEPMAHAAAAVMRSWGLPAAEAAAAGLCSQQAARAALLGLGAAASSGGLDSSAVYT